MSSQVSIEIGETIFPHHEQVQHRRPDISVSPGRPLAGVPVEKNDHHQPEYSSSTTQQQVPVSMEINTDDVVAGEILNKGGKNFDCRQSAFGNFNQQQDQANYDDHLHNHHSMVMALKKLVVGSFKDVTIILLVCCASLSLLIDVQRSGPETALVDGTIIFLSIFFVATFGNIFRFLKTRWMLKRSLQINKRKENFARVMRDGKSTQTIPASQIMAGDVVFLETGDLVPADGLFHDDGTDSCKIDFQSCHATNDHIIANSTTVSMFTGAKVVDGSCRMLVTSVGENTERSKLVGSLMRTDRGKQHPEESKFQNGIHGVSSLLEKIWLSLTLFILIVQVFRCFLCKSTCDESHNPDPKGVKNTVEEIMSEVTKIAKKQGGKSTNNGLVSVLCVLVFATRDGFPLGLFVLSFIASNKMKSLGVGAAMVQKLSVCATLGLVTTLCLNRPDDLTLNHAKMGELWVGLNLIQDASEELSSQVLGKLKVGVCMNNSSGCDHDQMEDSLLLWAQKAIHHHQVDNDDMSRNRTILNGSVEVLDKDKSLLVLRRTEGGKEVLEMHWKGDLDRIISQCSHYYDVDGIVQTLDEEKRTKFKCLVTRDYLQGFAFAYKKIAKVEESTSTEIKGEDSDHDDNHGEDDVRDIEKTQIVKVNVDPDHGWTLIGLVLLKNPFPPEVKQAIQACGDLGVNVKLMVDDDAKTARMMALSSGILNPDEQGGISEFAVMEGSDFRNYSEEGRMKIIDEVKAIANATPADKLLMVQCLKKKGEEVAITASCIRDLPSLVEADDGIFFLGYSNTSTSNIVPEMAKEDADIIFTRPPNTGEIARIIRFGRYVCQSIEMFLELHMILNFSAVTLNLISEVWKIEAKLSSAQLLWTNIVVEALGAFGVAVMLKMEPSKSNHQHHPEKDRGIPPPPPPPPPPVLCDGDIVGPVITKKMWRNVVIQTLCQVMTILVLLENLKGKDVVDRDDDGVIMKTMIFNTYILCQVFVLIGSSSGMKKKIKSGEGPTLILLSTENFLFLTVVGMILALQILMIEIMAVVTHSGNLDLKAWSVCIGIAGLSTLLGRAANWLINYLCGYMLRCCRSIINIVSHLLIS